MTTNRSQDTIAVIDIDCPWCGAPAHIGESSVHCPECALTVELVTEVREPVLAAAA